MILNLVWSKNQALGKYNTDIKTGEFLITLKNLGEALSIGRSAVQKRVAKGKLPKPVRQSPGTSTKFNVCEVYKYLDAVESREFFREVARTGRIEWEETAQGEDFGG